VIIPYSTIGNENFKGFFPKNKVIGESKWVKSHSWSEGAKAFKCKKGG
jgi:hypothetical protein